MIFLILIIFIFKNQFISTMSECPICSQVLQFPRTLPCEHIFCNSCIEQHLILTEDTYLCPTCNKPVQQVPASHDMLQNASPPDVPFSSSPPPASSAYDCTDCGEGTPAVEECVDCKKYLCED